MAMRMIHRHLFSNFRLLRGFAEGSAMSRRHGSLHCWRLPVITWRLQADRLVMDLQHLVDPQRDKRGHAP